ncbi:MAG: DUF2892 domain-containing protein [Thiobacillus sp.]
MAKNVGGIDRIVRAVLGVGLMASAGSLTGIDAIDNSDFIQNYMVPIGMIGFILFLTAIFKWCPAYLPFGINSNKAK